jgi:hypothetical protein
MKHLGTVEAVVDAMGGPGPTADWAGLGTSAVSNWIARGFIPPGWHWEMAEELRRRGFEVDPSVFGKRSPSSGRNPKHRAEARVA